MARQAVLDALDSTLGKYLCDLDTESLSVSLWEGRIEFPRNMKVNAEAINREFMHHLSSEDDEHGILRNLADNSWLCDDWIKMNVNCGRRRSPGAAGNMLNALNNVRVVGGSIHKVHIDVPWAALASRPVVVRVSGVRLVMSPLQRQSQSSYSSAATSMTSINPHDHESHGPGSTLSGHVPYTEEYSHAATFRSHRPCSVNTGSGKPGNPPKKSYFTDMLKSLPYSFQIGHESRQNREESFIRKKRRNIIEIREKERKRNEALRRSLFSAHDKTTDTHRSNLNPSESMPSRSISEPKFGLQTRNHGETKHGLTMSQGSNQRINQGRQGVNKRNPKVQADKRTSFRERLKTRIMENLQLDITDVHIQFKSNDVGKPSYVDSEHIRKFLAGMVIDSISFDTTDEHGRRAYVDRTSYGPGADFLFKAFRISGFGVYLDDINNTVDDDDSSVVDQGSVMSRSSKDDISYVSNSALRRDYIISPLSFEAAYHQSDNVHNSADYPKYLLFSQLPHISAVLSRTQVELFYDIIHSLRQRGPCPLFPEYRPACSITSLTAKKWWKYAVRSIGRMTRRRSWVEFFLAFQIRNRYVNLYKRQQNHNECEWLDPLSSEETSELQKIEDDRTISVEGIIQWRILAKTQINLEKLDHLSEILLGQNVSRRQVTALGNENPKKTTGFFKNLFKNPTLPPPEDDYSSAAYQSFTLTAEEIQELETQLEYLSDSVIPDGSKLLEIELTMGSLVVDLVDASNSHPFAKLRLGTFETSFTCTAGGASSLSTSLLSLQVEDQMSLQPIFPSIVRSIHTKTTIDETGTETWTRAIRFTMKKSRDGHRKITLNVIPVEIVMSSSFFSGISDFFQLDACGKFVGTSFASCLNDIISNKYDSISGAISGIWRDKLRKKLKWKLDCEIEAPVLVFPENCHDPGTTVVVIDLGKYRIFSSNELKSKMEEYFGLKFGRKFSSSAVDSWRIELNNMTFMIGTASLCDWLQRKTGRNVPRSSRVSKSIIDRFSFTLDMGSCPIDDDLSGVYLDCRLPSIDFCIDQKILNRVCKMFSMWYFSLDNIRGFSMFQPRVSWGVNKIPVGNDIPTSIDKSPASSSYLSPSLIHESFICRERNGSNGSLYYNITFEKISVSIFFGLCASIEAHVISVSTSASVDHGGSFISNLRIGSILILDRSNSPPKTLIHSWLPYSMNDISVDQLAQLIETNDLYEELTKDSTDVSHLVEASVSISEETKSMKFLCDDSSIHSQKQLTFDIHISNLFLNWHRRPLDQILEVIEEARNIFTAYIKNTEDATGGACLTRENDEESDATVSTESSLKEARPSRIYSLVGKLFPVVKATRKLIMDQFPPVPIRLRAKINTLEVKMSSSKDNKVFFVYSMNGIIISMKKLGETSEKMLEVGDLRIDLPLHGKIAPAYENIISFSSDSKMKRVFQVKQNKCFLPDGTGDINRLQSFISAKISPFRFVFLNEQINFFVSSLRESLPIYIISYISSSLATYAQTLSRQPQDEEFFDLSTTKSEIVIPRSLLNPEYFKIIVDEIGMRYNQFPHSGAGKGNVGLKGIAIKCKDHIPLLSEPVRITVDVDVSANPDPEVQHSVTVDASTSSIAISLTADQYIQVIATYNGNFLGNIVPTGGVTSLPIKETDQNQRKKNQLTRQKKNSGGMIWMKKINIFVQFPTIYIDLCEADIRHPIFSLDAEGVKVVLKANPKEKVHNTDLILRNLGVEYLQDNRRNLSSLVSGIGDGKIETEEYLFILHYTQHPDGSMDVGLIIGSIQVSLIPDAVEQAFLFLNYARGAAEEERKELNDITHLKKEEAMNNIHRTIKHLDHPIAKCDKTSHSDNINFSLNLTHGRLIFFQNTYTLSQVVSVGDPSVLVLETKMNAQLVHPKTNNKGMTAQFSCDNFEIYKAEGHWLNNSIQILEPTGFSFIAYISNSNTTSSIEVKFVYVSTIDVIFSTQDIALFSVLLSNMKKQFLLEPFTLSKYQERYHVRDPDIDIDEKSVGKSNEKNDKGKDNEDKSVEEIGADISNGDKSISEKENSDNNPNLNGKKLNVDNLVEVSLDENCDSKSNTAGQNTSVEERSIEEGKYIEDGDKVGESEDEIITKENNADRNGNFALTSKLTSCPTLHLPWLESSGLIRHCRKYVDDMVTTIQLSTSLPKVSLVIIDDLNGRDQALLKVVTDNIVGGGEGRIKFLPTNQISPMDTTFDFNAHLAVLSEHYDFTSNRWEPLLTEPWDISINLSRTKDEEGDTKGSYLTFDIRSDSCSMSFTEQFLISLTRLVYVESMLNRFWEQISDVQSKDEKEVIKPETSTPYGIDNRTGVTVYFNFDDACQPEPCETGTTKYFCFKTPALKGTGGKRLYGQDVLDFKTITVFIGECQSRNEIVIPHLDNEVNCCRYFEIGDRQVIFTEVVKTEQNATILCIRSRILVYNYTHLPFDLSIKNQDSISDLEHLPAAFPAIDSLFLPESFSCFDPNCRCIGVPDEKIKHFYSTKALLSEKDFLFSPPSMMFRIEGTSLGVSDNYFTANFVLPSHANLRQAAASDKPVITLDLKFSPESSPDVVNDVSVQASIRVTSVGGEPFVAVFLQPRAVIHNSLPINVLVRTKAPYTSSLISRHGEKDDNTGQRIHRLEPFQKMQVYSPSPEIVISLECADKPIAGGVSGSVRENCVNLPLDRDNQMANSIKCVFPCENTIGVASEFLLREVQFEDEVRIDDSDEVSNTGDISLLFNPRKQIRTISLSACNVGVDHTDDLFFQTVRFQMINVRKMNKFSFPADASKISFSAFRSKHYSQCISILPDSETQIRLVEKYGESSKDRRRTLPFQINDVSVGRGGFDSSTLFWEDHSRSGYFAYRKMGDSLSTPCELHIIPEYQVFNASDYPFSLWDSSQKEKVLEINPGEKFPVKKDPSSELILIFELEALNCRTDPVRVDQFGLQVCNLKLSSNGRTTGTLSIECKVGGKRERVLVHFGPVKVCKNAKDIVTQCRKDMANFWKHDFVRFSVNFKRLQVMFTDASNPLKPPRDVASALLEKISFVLEHSFLSGREMLTEEEPNIKELDSLDERSRLSIKIRDAKWKDCDPKVEFPIILSGSSPDCDFIDFSMYFRGSESDDAVVVDMVNINIQHINGKQNKIVLNGREDFFIRIFDIIDRTRETADGQSKTRLHNKLTEKSETIHATGNKIVPHHLSQVRSLFDFKAIFISPVEFEVNVQGRSRELPDCILCGRGAAFINHLSKEVQFPVICEELMLPKYFISNVKSHPCDLLQKILAVYMSRLKFKWNNLTDSKFNENEFCLLHGTDDDFVLSDLSNFFQNEPHLEFTEVKKQALCGYKKAFCDIDETNDEVKECNENGIVKNVDDGQSFTLSACEIVRRFSLVNNAEGNM